MKPPAKCGRPSIYTEELADKICKAISISLVSLPRMCEANPSFPSSETIRVWKRDIPSFSVKYLTARKDQVDNSLIELDAIEDATVAHYVDDKGQSRIDPASVALATLKSNNRKFVAARLLPKVWDDKKKDELVDKQVETLDAVNTLVKTIQKEHDKDV